MSLRFGILGLTVSSFWGKDRKLPNIPGFSPSLSLPQSIPVNLSQPPSLQYPGILSLSLFPSLSQSTFLNLPLFNIPGFSPSLSSPFYPSQPPSTSLSSLSRDSLPLSLSPTLSQSTSLPPSLFNIPGFSPSLSLPRSIPVIAFGEGHTYDGLVFHERRNKPQCLCIYLPILHIIFVTRASSREGENVSVRAMLRTRRIVLS